MCEPLHGEDYEVIYGRPDYKGKIVCDAGADYGSTAYFFRKKGAKLIVSVECNERYFAQLLENCKKWHNVVPVKLRITDKDHWKYLINTYRFDIIKADCEGCEFSLLNLDDSLLKTVKEYLIEIHTGKIEKFKEKFISNNYEIIDENICGPDLVILYVRRKDKL